MVQMILARRLAEAGCPWSESRFAVSGLLGFINKNQNRSGETIIVNLEGRLPAQKRSESITHGKMRNFPEPFEQAKFISWQAELL
jgi:hypothetical protein